jgi:hypothetical protein
METYPAAFPRQPAFGCSAGSRLTCGDPRSRPGTALEQHPESASDPLDGQGGYLEALAAGEPRRNLDCTLAGAPSERERVRAAESLEARKANAATDGARL